MSLRKKVLWQKEQGQQLRGLKNQTRWRQGYYWPITVRWRGGNKDGECGQKDDKEEEVDVGIQGGWAEK